MSGIMTAVAVGKRRKGETDDSPRVQRAIDKAAKLKNGVVVISAATYVFRPKKRRGKR